MQREQEEAGLTDRTPCRYDRAGEGSQGDRKGSLRLQCGSEKVQLSQWASLSQSVIREDGCLPLVLGLSRAASGNYPSQRPILGQVVDYMRKTNDLQINYQMEPIYHCVTLCNG